MRKRGGPPTDKQPSRRSESSAVAKLAERLGYEFRNPALLEQALTHGSFYYEQTNRVEHPAPSDNERLEFLGDAALGLAAAEALYAQFPQAREGLLTQMRSQIVSRRHLGEVALRMKLGSALRLGRGEERSGGRTKPVVVANALEALAGAMFLDGGLPPVRELLLNHIAASELRSFSSAVDGGGTLNDAKSALQERLQAEGAVRAEYMLLSESGPDHDKKFSMQVSALLGGRVRTAKANGRTKKQAEQEAARKLLTRLQAEGERA